MRIDCPADELKMSAFAAVVQAYERLNATVTLVKRAVAALHMRVTAALMPSSSSLPLPSLTDVSQPVFSMVHGNDPHLKAICQAAVMPQAGQARSRSRMYSGAPLPTVNEEQELVDGHGEQHGSDHAMLPTESTPTRSAEHSTGPGGPSEHTRREQAGQSRSSSEAKDRVWGSRRRRDRTAAARCRNAGVTNRAGSGNPWDVIDKSTTADALQFLADLEFGLDVCIERVMAANDGTEMQGPIPATAL